MAKTKGTPTVAKGAPAGFNLFTTKTVDKTAKAKAEKKVIPVPGLKNNIAEFKAAKAAEEEAKARKEALGAEIKTVGRDLFAKEYRTMGSMPENFKMADASGAEVMFIVNDKYTTVSPEKAELIRAIDEKHLADLKKAKREAMFAPLLTEVNTFTMDAKLVEKYGAVLSKLIIECKEIDDDDKPNLITGTKTYAVATGSVKKLLEYGNDFEEVMEVINPIVGLK